MSVGLGEEWVIYPQTGLAEICVEQNDLEPASRWIQSATEYLSRADIGAISWIHAIPIYCRITNCLLAFGDLETASDLSNRFRDMLAQNSHLSVQPLGEAIDAQVRVWLAAGDIASARDFLRHTGQHAYGLGTLKAAGRLAIARSQNADGDFEGALETLRKVEHRVRAAQAVELLIEVLCLQAIALGSSGMREGSSRVLQEALDLGRKRGYLRIFAAQGQEIHQLLDDLLNAGRQNGQDSVAQEYLEHVLAVFTSGGKAPSSAAGRAAAGMRLHASSLLSSREIQVGKLWTEGYSAKEIAVALAISLNTAKVHLKSIYKKLDVHERRDFIARARALGVLDS